MLTVLSLRCDEPDARFEKLWKPDMMLCGLREERWEDDRLGGLSAAYGCRCWIDERPGDELGRGEEVDGGVAGGGPLGGVSRFGSTPCRDQRFVSKDVRGGCSFDPDPIDDADDQDDLGRPDEEPTPLTLRVGVVEGDTGEGDDDEDLWRRAGWLQTVLDAGEVVDDNQRSRGHAHGNDHGRARRSMDRGAP